MKDFIYTAALVFTGFLIGMLATLLMIRKTVETTPAPVTPSRPDSIRVSTPPVIVRTDTVWMATVPLPIKLPATAGLSGDSADQAQNSPKDSAVFSVSHKDSALVAIPIVEQTFQGEYYKAVVQGYSPVLKSIEIWHPDPPKPKQKIWSVTIGPQVGYGFTPAGWQPYAGLGVTIGISF